MSTSKPASRHQIYAGLFATALLFAADGCKPSPPPASNQDQARREEPVAPTSPDPRRKPSADDLARFFRSQVPAQLKLVDLKADSPVPLPNAAPGSNAWVYNVRVVFAPTEDLLGAPAPQAAATFQAAADELGVLAAWSQAYTHSPYASRYPACTVEPPDPAQPKLVTVLHAKDQPLSPLYGKMSAEWQVDHWNYALESLQPPADDGSKLRNEYAGPVLVQGNPEAEQFLAKVKASVATAKTQQAAIEAAYRADLLKATQPGTLFRGQLRYHGGTAPVEVRLTPPPAGTDPQQEVQLELRLPNTPGESFTYLAQRAKRLPLRPAALAETNGTLPTLTLEGTEPLPKGDLTLSFVDCTGKLGVLNDTVPVAFLQINRGNSQPGSVTLQIHDGNLEGRLNGYLDMESASFMLSARQSP